MSRAGTSRLIESFGFSNNIELLLLPLILVCCFCAVGQVTLVQTPLPVCVDGKCGYIDKRGKVVLPLQFDQAEGFSEGVAAVRVGIKWGFIDLNGQVVIAPKFQSTGRFSDGLAPVRTQEVWGYVDKSGRLVIEPQFDEAENFSDGFARVRSGYETRYIDTTGKIATVRFNGAASFEKGPTPVLINGKVGYVDRSLSNVVIGPRFNDAGYFSEGLAPVEISGKWGYINMTGHVVIRPQFSSAESFHDGRALVGIRSTNRKGYINAHGKVVIPPRFWIAQSFSGGLAAVVLGGRIRANPMEHAGGEFVGGRWAYIDRTGAVTIKLDLLTDYAASFSAGIAYVRMKDGAAGYIDGSGHYIWRPSK